MHVWYSHRYAYSPLVTEPSDLRMYSNSIVVSLLKLNMVLQRNSDAHVHSPWKENPTVLPHTCWLVRWWVAREHLKIVGCRLWEPHSPDSTWQYVRVVGQ